MFDSDALYEAREREGAAAEDRPSEVDSILEPKERVGHGNELPLLEREYSAYPSGDELLRPAEGDTLRTLAEHDKVHSVEDVASELNTTEGKVRKAAELHGVSLPSGSSFDIEVSRLTTLLGDIPEGMKSSTNPILIATLYVEKGLSTQEIAGILSEGESNARESKVTQVLVDCHILEGLTTEEREYQTKQNRGELNKPRYSGGVNIDTTDL